MPVDGSAVGALCFVSINPSLGHRLVAVWARVRAAFGDG